MSKQVKLMRTSRYFPALWQGALIALSLSTASVSRADQTPPQSDTDPAHLDTLRAQAEAAADAGHLSEAVEVWHAAWSLRPDDPRVACGMGGAELRLGNHADAAMWMARCVRLTPKATTEHAIERSKQYTLELLTAKAKVSTLTITVEPGAQILVDNRAPQVAPLTDDIYVEPGRHHIEAHSGARSVSSDLSTEAGKEYVIPLKLPQTATAALVRPSAPVSREPRQHFRWWPVVVGGSGTAIGLVLGAVFTGKANAASVKENQALSVLAANGESCLIPAPAALPARCGDYIEYNIQHGTYYDAAAWSFVGAGVFALAAGGYAFFESRRISVAPTLGGFIGKYQW